MIEPHLPATTTRRLPRILLFLAAGTAGLLLVAGAWYSYSLGGSADGHPVRVVVEPGDSAGSIASQLEEAGVIRSALAFRIHVRFNDAATALKPGAYDLREGLGARDAIQALVEGIPLKVFRFTIPEGRALGQIAKIVAANTPISAKAFLAAAHSGKHRSDLAPDARNLEGLLWPDTYEIAEDVDADGVVQLLVDEFEARAERLQIRERSRSLGISPYEAIIVASLIEREARTQPDRPKIASVIYNRLAIPMRLQIDATVQYLLFLRDGEWPDRILFRDLEIESPYNTYRSDGLPPTPIASPGEAALQAALNPAETEFLYYVACGADGGHEFARTGSEHNANVRRCR
ncbi:MAG: endolytic transglycosylase MltG [Actinomycetota bacterium]